MPAGAEVPAALLAGLSAAVVLALIVVVIV